MAKKKGANKRAGKKAAKKGTRTIKKKKTPKKTGKRASSPARAMARAGSKKGASAGTAATMRAAAALRHKKSRIGLTRNLHIEADGVFHNVFQVYGDSIGAKNPNTSTHPDHKHVKKPKGKHHKFEFVGTPGWTDVDDNTIEITATCLPTFTSKRKKASFGTDDLTVTIVLDEGTSNPDTTECTFEDVDYNP